MAQDTVAPDLVAIDPAVFEDLASGLATWRVPNTIDYLDLQVMEERLRARVVVTIAALACSSSSQGGRSD